MNNVTPIRPPEGAPPQKPVRRRRDANAGAARQELLDRLHEQLGILAMCRGAAARMVGDGDDVDLEYLEITLCNAVEVLKHVHGELQELQKSCR